MDANQLKGAMNRDAGNSFEDEIEATFKPYRDSDIATLSKYPVPMRPTGQRHPRTNQPLYAEKGKAPFDIWGWMHYDGRVIGAELKCTNQAETSMPIILPGSDGKARKGRGLQFHQLDALYNVARCHGVARVVWSNGGQVGVLTEKRIMNAWASCWSAWKIETAGVGKPRQGLKSIKWELFESVGYKPLGSFAVPVLAWLEHEKAIIR